MDLASRREYFLKIWRLAYAKYSKSSKRLAGEGWGEDWQLLITTMLSAQNRDEVTIPVAEDFFKKFSSLKMIDDASLGDIIKSIKSINYNVTKARHIKDAVRVLIERYNSRVPRSKEDLLLLKGVGIKTANLVLAELFNDQEICVDTHVHRIANVFGFVKTSSPVETEVALKEVVPRRYWNKINRIFVLWGQDVRGYCVDDFLLKLEE